MHPNAVKALALQLTAFKSVTGTPGERDFAPFLKKLLSGWPVLQAHPENLWLERTLDDPHQRYSLFALVRGDGPQTLLLTGHYDTVSTENYGPLEPLACNPEALRAALLKELRTASRGEEDEVLQQLETDFLPGRGLLDMKSGLAAGLGVLHAWSERAERPGNLLFVAVPDEEVASHGMRSVVRQLPGVCRERELRLELAVNLDVSAEPALFLGSVGKLLPFVLFVGRPTHVGAPFGGVNPALLAADFATHIEANPAYGDAAGRAAYPAPPSVLYQRDNRSHYDVTTPTTAFCAVNVLTHHRSPSEVLAGFETLAGESLARCLALLNERHAEHAQRSGTEANIPPWSPTVWSPTVLTFEMLLERARSLDEAATERVLRDTLPGAEIVERCNAVAQALVHLVGLDGPAAVVGFAPPYYPRSEVNRERHGEVVELLKREVEQVGVAVRPFFDGISDMSFFSPSDDAAARAFVAAHTPFARVETASPAPCPVVNLGPWGHDYHQRLERVHAPYAFETLPELLQRVAERVLSR